MAQPESDKELETEYCNQIRDFFNSAACKQFMLPMIQQLVTKELPKPNTPDWQTKYQYAFALSDAFTLIINSMNNLAGRDEFIAKVEKMLDEGGADPSAPVDEA